MLPGTIKYKTPITYYGGKQRMITKILTIIPRHRIYCEPFFGGGAIFFAKSPSYLEVINDKNDILMSFYSTCQSRFDELQMLIHNSLCSEQLFRWAKSVYFGTEKADLLHTAFATWVVFNLSFNSSPKSGWRWDNGTDNSHIGIVLKHARQNFCPWIRQRLSKVQISCRDANDVIKQRDTPDTFFYLDPPYPNTNQAHYCGYSEDDLDNLLILLSNIHGQFCLSNYNHPLLQEYARKKNWLLQVFPMAKTITNKSSKSFKEEALLLNYSPNNLIQTNLF